MQFHSNEEVANYFAENPGLREFVIEESVFVTVLPDFPDSLGRIVIRKCPALKAVPALPETLVELIIDDCKMLEHIPRLPDALQIMFFRNCGRADLPALPGDMYCFVAVTPKGIPAYTDVLIEGEMSGAVLFSRDAL